MTTEDDFQRRLDEDADDHLTRLVFADWLQDRGDPRADGYRALGVGGHCPYQLGPGREPQWYRDVKTSLRQTYGRIHPASDLPGDWFDAIDWPTMPLGFKSQPATRREAEDAAALAFLSLPPARRAALLAPSGTAVNGG